MDFNFEEKIYFEDEYAKYYTNSFTKTLTKYAQEDNPTNGNKGIKCFVLLADKNGYREYVIFNDKGIPIYANSSYEAISVIIDILQFKTMCEVQRNEERSN